HTGAVHALAFSPDDKTLASGGMDGAVVLWDVAGAQLLRDVRPPGGGGLPLVQALAFAPNGRALACGWGYTVRLLDPGTGKWLRSLENLRLGDDPALPPGWGLQSRAGVLALAFSPDGRTLAAGARHAVRLWDLARARECSFGGHRGG